MSIEFEYYATPLLEIEYDVDVCSRTRHFFARLRLATHKTRRLSVMDAQRELNAEMERMGGFTDAVKWIEGRRRRLRERSE